MARPQQSLQRRVMRADPVVSSGASRPFGRQYAGRFSF